MFAGKGYRGAKNNTRRLAVGEGHGNMKTVPSLSYHSKRTIELHLSKHQMTVEWKRDTETRHTGHRRDVEICGQ